MIKDLHRLLLLQVLLGLVMTHISSNRIKILVMEVYLLLILLAVGRPAFGQDRDHTETMILPSQPRAGASGCLSGKPFSGQFRRTKSQSSDEETSWVSRMYRNAAGTIRTDDSKGQYSWILDCEKGRSVFIDHSEKVALSFPISLSGSISTIGFKKYPAPTRDKTAILDVDCQKILLFNDKGATEKVGEIWIAPDLGIVLRDSEILPSGSLLWEAVSLSFSEPETINFSIPSTYKVQEVHDVSPPQMSLKKP